MTTFIAVNDHFLIEKIKEARQRIIFIAPAISMKLSVSLGSMLENLENLDVTVILDSSEDVCRIGYGDIEGLKSLHSLSNKYHFPLRSQVGIRTGVLIVDDNLFVWTPTPLSVEENSYSNKIPNGMQLGNNPTEQIAFAIAAEGTDTKISDSEIAVEAVSREEIEKTHSAILKNPPVPIDLARATKVFNSKFQFVELEIRNVSISKRQINIPKNLLNIDASEEISELLETKIRALNDLRTHIVEIREFSDDGTASLGPNDKQKTYQATEATLAAKRIVIERKYIYKLPNYGAIMEKNKVLEFELSFDSYLIQLNEYAEGIKQHIENESSKIVNELVELILKRSKNSINGSSIDTIKLKSRILENINLIKDEKPKVEYIYKDITYQQTKDENFFKLIKSKVPPSIMKKVGGENWAGEFLTVKARDHDLFSYD